MLTLKEYNLIGRQPTWTTGEDGEYIVDYNGNLLALYYIYIYIFHI
jgi:hypothetical protein